MSSDLSIQNGDVQDPFAFLTQPLGPKDPVGGIVLGYLMDASLSQHPELGPLNKQVMVGEARHLSYRHPEDGVQEDNIEEATNELIAEVAPQFEILAHHPELIRVWKRFQQEKELALQEENPEVRQRRLSYLFANLQRSRNALATLQRDPEDGEARNLLASNLGNPLVARRFQSVVEREHLDPTNPQQIADCFAALHRNQRNTASAQGAETLQIFDEAVQRESPDSFSLGRYSSAERALFTRSQNEDLHNLWNAATRFHEDALIPLLPARPADQPDWDPIEHGVRPCLNNPANAAALNGVGVMILNYVRGIAPEIGRFTRLHTLCLSAGREPNQKLMGLPEEMRSLQHLSKLDVERYESHAFREIPPVIRELRALEVLTLSGPIEEIPEWLADLPHLHYLELRGSNIRVISDAIWQQCYWNPEGRRLKPQFIDFLWGTRTRAINRSEATFRINSQQLTDIPFTLAFLRKWESRYFPIIDAVFGLNPRDLNPHWPWQLGVFMFLFILLGIVIVGPFFILQTVLNLPLFLYNLTLRYLIEPRRRAAWIAEHGSAMVHVGAAEAAE